MLSKTVELGVKKTDHKMPPRGKRHFVERKNRRRAKPLRKIIGVHAKRFTLCGG